nr:MAG: hypothetical protein [Chemarfal virus 228]
MDDPPDYEDFIECVDFMLTYQTEAACQAAFPFRVKGEAALRRARMTDILTIYPTAALRPLLLMFSGTRSYIFVLNMLLMNWCCAHFPYIEWWYTRGALENIPTFLTFAKKVTTLIKSTVADTSFFPLIECTGMAGYRLLPDPSFDIVAATEAAATGFGTVHSTSDGLREPFGWFDCASVLDVGPASFTPTTDRLED